MGYFNSNFRNFRGKRRNFKRKVAKQKPTAYNQKEQILALSSKVSNLYKRSAQKRIYRQCALSGTFQTSANYAVWNPMTPQLWTRLGNWTTSAKKMYLKSLYFDHLITCNTEVNPITYTFFLVSLRPSTGKRLVENAGEFLASMTDGIHYYTYNSKLVHLNKDYFRVHYAKRFTITAIEYTDNETGGSNPRTTWKRFSHGIKWPRLLKSPAGGEVLTGTASDEVPIGNRLYCLMFNDNSAADLEYNQWDCTCLINLWE